jgi:hypothetical protein
MPEMSNNTCVGTNAGFSNTAASNSFFGFGSGQNNTNGTANVYLGKQSGYTNTSGGYNTCAGVLSGYSNTGYDNTFFGYSSGYNNTGHANTAIGKNSGLTTTSGVGNTALGYGADVAAACSTFTNMTAIGYNTVVSVAATGNYVGVGNTSVGSIQGQVGFGTYSDSRIKNTVKENVPGLAFINLLRPVTYHYDIHKENSILGYPMKKDSTGKNIGIDTTYWKGKYEIEKKQFSGFIAQEVDSAAKQIGYDFSGVDKNGTLMSLRYAEFAVPLVKAVQELSKTVDSLKTVINKTGGQRTNTSGDGQGNKETTSQIDLANNSATILYQNEPNPFDGSTVIRYFIPVNVTGSAFVVFYDMYGKEVNKLEIRERGFGKIEANTENLASGIYSYSIIVDGKSIDTKKMLKSK